MTDLNDMTKALLQWDWIQTKQIEVSERETSTEPCPQRPQNFLSNISVIIVNVKEMIVATEDFRLNVRERSIYLICNDLTV